MFIPVSDIQPLEKSLDYLHLVCCVAFVTLGLLNVDTDKVKDAHFEIHYLLVFVVVLQTRQIIRSLLSRGFLCSQGLSWQVLWLF